MNLLLVGLICGCFGSDNCPNYPYSENTMLLSECIAGTLAGLVLIFAFIQLRVRKVSPIEPNNQQQGHDFLLNHPQQQLTTDQQLPFTNFSLLKGYLWVFGVLLCAIILAI
jgi:hypothetical protein